MELQVCLTCPQEHRYAGVTRVGTGMLGATGRHGSVIGRSMIYCFQHYLIPRTASIPLPSTVDRQIA